VAVLSETTDQVVAVTTYRKNDNAWVEQRNWTHMRKEVGYRRFDTAGELAALYAALRLYKDFFQPALKLKAKERVGGKIHRKYEAAATPYQRLLDSGRLSAVAEKRLRSSMNDSMWSN
jgi:hypothetical protein